MNATTRHITPSRVDGLIVAATTAGFGAVWMDAPRPTALVALAAAITAAVFKPDNDSDEETTS